VQADRNVDGGWVGERVLASMSGRPADFASSGR